MSRGTLLLDAETILDAPKFFCILALVERAAGAKVVVVDTKGDRRNGAKFFGSLGIPMHEYYQVPGGTKNLHTWKTEKAKAMAAPLLWLDLDFGKWLGPDLGHLNYITLDWSRARQVEPQVITPIG